MTLAVALDDGAQRQIAAGSNPVWALLSLRAAPEVPPPSRGSLLSTRGMSRVPRSILFGSDTFSASVVRSLCWSPGWSTSTCTSAVTAAPVRSLPSGASCSTRSCLDTSPQAELVVVAEVVAIVLLASTFVPHVARAGRIAQDPSPRHGRCRHGRCVRCVGVVLGRQVRDDRGRRRTDLSGDRRLRVHAAGAHGPVGSDGDLDERRRGRSQRVRADRSFSGGALGRGATFQVTFDTPGEHAYLCGFHPEMTGTITVTP